MEFFGKQAVKVQRMAVVFAFFLMLPALAWADCGCSMGSNYIYIIGFELIAQSCPLNPSTDDTPYTYLMNPIQCPGSQITKSSTYGDTTGSPNQLISYYISQGYRVIRNPSGTHLICVQNGSYPFTGTVAGISMAGKPAGVYETTPAENLNEYCTAWPLPDQDNDYFPDCLDCAPGDVNQNAVCSAAPEFDIKANLGPGCQR